MGMFWQLPSQPYACSTGNCSYPVINTLGVCSTCLNVTSQSTMGHCAAGNDKNNPMETCYVATPGGFSLSVEKGIVSATRIYNTLLSAAAAHQSDIALPDIMNFAMYRSAADTFYSSTTLGPDSQTYECSLRFCERSYACLQVIDGTANNPEQTSTNFSTSGSQGENYVLFSSNAEPDLT